MSIIISKKNSTNKQKVWYYIEWGKGKGQRVATKIFTYTKPKDQLQKNHNKEALAILESKKSQMILEGQSVNSGYIPQHKLKANFLEYYEEYVKANKSITNRHLRHSLQSFRKFIGTNFITPIDITENKCEQFRDYLLKNLRGETPSGYFHRFKKVLRAAAKDGYFRYSPAQDIIAKSSPQRIIKEILTAEEYVTLLKTPCLNYEVKKAFIVSLYTGLRWVEIKNLKWEDVHEECIKIIQTKTNITVEKPFHHLAKHVMGERRTGLVFKLPTANGANGVLADWCKDAGINKHITWHCARHSFSVILQLNGTDLATVAGLLGHTTTKYVQKTYQRYIKVEGITAISKLPEF